MHLLQLRLMCLSTVEDQGPVLPLPSVLVVEFWLRSALAWSALFLVRSLCRLDGPDWVVFFFSSLLSLSSSSDFYFNPSPVLRLPQLLRHYLGRESGFWAHVTARRLDPVWNLLSL